MLFTAECSFNLDSTNIEAISAVKDPTRTIPNIKENTAEHQPKNVLGGAVSKPDIVNIAIALSASK